MIGREAEFLKQLLEGCGRAERFHPDDASVVTDITMPSEIRGLLDGDARFDVRRNDLLTIFKWLFFENLPRRHAHDTRINALRPELLVNIDAQRDFATGGKE